MILIKFMPLILGMSTSLAQNQMPPPPMGNYRTPINLKPKIDACLVKLRSSSGSQGSTPPPTDERFVLNKISEHRENEVLESISAKETQKVSILKVMRQQ